MENVAVICELNPMHSGHQYLFSQIRMRHPESRIICIMSGNYVQRGDVAIASKYLRAEIAVRLGVDLVLELPLPYCIMQADRFAFGAIEILNALGNIDFLYFGSECGQIDCLRSLAYQLCNKECENQVISIMKSDRRLTYSSALKQALGAEAELPEGANDVLGIEYIKALIRTNSRIVPVAIQRIGNSHDSQTVIQGFASASKLRQLAKDSSWQEMEGLLETKEYNILTKAKKNDLFPIQIENAQRALLSFFREGKYTGGNSQWQAFSRFATNCAKQSASLEDLMFRLKSKHFTLARIRRMLLALFLEMPDSLGMEKPEYTNVLGFNKQGREFLKEIKKNCPIHVITKPAAMKKLAPFSKQIQCNINADRKHTLFYPTIQKEDSIFKAGAYYREE